VYNNLDDDGVSKQVRIRGYEMPSSCRDKLVSERRRSASLCLAREHKHASNDVGKLVCRLPFRHVSTGDVTKSGIPIVSSSVSYHQPGRDDAEMMAESRSLAGMDLSWCRTNGYVGISINTMPSINQ